MRANAAASIAGLVLGLAIGACRAGSAGAPPAPVPAGAGRDGLGVQVGHHHDPEVRWLTVASFDELVLRSDLVVRGRVEARRPGWARSQGWSRAAQWISTSQETGEVHHDLPLVISTVRVGEILRAGERASTTVGGGTIEIVELGGRLEDGCFSEPADKPVLKRGEEAVFFLSSAGRPGAYQVVGGWQGRVWVVGGKVHSLAADVHPGDPAATVHDGRPVDRLIQAVAIVPRAS